MKPVITTNVCKSVIATPIEEYNFIKYKLHMYNFIKYKYIVMSQYIGSFYVSFYCRTQSYLKNLKQQSVKKMEKTLLNKSEEKTLIKDPTTHDDDLHKV
jgi:hypothetical protein